MDKPLLFPKREGKYSPTTPKFQLTKKIPITVYRATPGAWVKGRWVKGEAVELVVEANVQPMRGHELIVLPEADRTKESIKVYCVGTLQTVEDVAQEEADIIIWNEKKFRAIRTMPYQMGVLDHTKTICVRLPETPQNKANVAPAVPPIGGVNG